MLRNRSLALEGLNIIGLDDLWANRCDIAKGLENLDTNQANLVLAHNPDTCDLPGWKDFSGWILSGHTHGAQMGVELPQFGIKLSPVSVRYKRCA